MAKKTNKKDRPHYVDNIKFSASVNEYVEAVNIAKDNEAPVPVVPRYIAECFMLTSEGLSHAHNFVRYPFREEMVLDGIENCLRAINNYDISKATRTGKPNAFSYFTQICFYAFVRRIVKEKKQQAIQEKIIENLTHNMILENDEDTYISFLQDGVDQFKLDNEKFERESKSDEEEQEPVKNVKPEHPSNINKFM